MGEIQLGATNYERVLRQDPDNLEACVYLAQARKEVTHLGGLSYCLAHT